MSEVGVLSSSLYRIMTGHAKCDALLTAIAHTKPTAATSECHELPSNFATQEFQRHAFPPASADRRSLKGSYFVPLSAVSALLRAQTPFFLRDTMQRALVDAHGHVVDEFTRAKVVRDSSKRARALTATEAHLAQRESAVEHWNSLRELLRVIECVNTDGTQEYVEIPPCSCFNCRKHVDPRANVRLLLFAFVPEIRFVDVVVARRRGKPLPQHHNNSSSSGSHEDDHFEEIYNIDSTPIAAPTVVAPAVDLFEVPPPPPMPMPMAPIADVSDAEAMRKSFTNQFVLQMRESIRDSMRPEVDAAIADATQALRNRYEYRLLQSQNEVRALQQQVEQLQRQMQSMSLQEDRQQPQPAFANNSAILNPPILVKSEFGASTSMFDSNDFVMDDLLSASSFATNLTPPRKRRLQLDSSNPLQSSSTTAVCRDQAWLEVPPHSPTQSDLFVY